MEVKQKEEKYLVIKLMDIENYLTDEDKRRLNCVLKSIRIGRMLDNKGQNHYVVVNEEEPYAEKVWGLVLGRQN